MNGISRRTLGRIGVGLVAGLHGSGLSTTAFASPSDTPLARVIVDNDFSGDPDGLLALAYQMAAPATRTVLVTASALDAKLAALAGTVPPGRTAASGAQLAAELARRVGGAPLPPIIAGAETFGTGVDQVTRAAHAIVAEARRSDTVPLYLTCGGPLTNVAAALRIDPGIATRMTVIWIGGRSSPDGGAEYNLATDPDAARQVIEGSSVPLWQVPVEAYAEVVLSHSELAADLQPISALTQWVHSKLLDLPSFVPPSGFKGLGDCALATLTTVGAEAGRFADEPARRIHPDLTLGEPVPGRTIRRYHNLDVRLLVSDMLATFRLHAQSRDGGGPTN